MKISTRGRLVAEMIRDRKFFLTHGALSASGMRSEGQLCAEEREALYAEQPSYVVYSYATPIAWWSEAHGWHRVDQKFSVTTSHHQGRLYLIGVV